MAPKNLSLRRQERGIGDISGYGNLEFVMSRFDRKWFLGLNYIYYLHTHPIFQYVTAECARNVATQDVGQDYVYLNDFNAICTYHFNIQTKAPTNYQKSRSASHFPFPTPLTLICTLHYYPLLGHGSERMWTSEWGEDLSYHREDVLVRILQINPSTTQRPK